jgi:hypothetical protein
MLGRCYTRGLRVAVETRNLRCVYSHSSADVAGIELGIAPGIEERPNDRPSACAR